MRRSPRAQAWASMTGDQFRSVKGIAWRYPEWWSVALSAIAWVVLIARAGPAAFGFDSSQRHQDTAPQVLVSETTEWLLMVVAMMVPLVVGSIRVTAARSLWARRHRAIVGFLVGYVALWMGAGFIVVLVSGVLALPDRIHSSAAAAAAFAVAAIWQRTSLKWRAIYACHRTIPLAPRGRRASLDCLRYGSMIGTRCLVSCWALMLACFVAHSLTTMVCAGAVAAADRYLPRPAREVVGGMIPGLALTWAIVALR